MTDEKICPIMTKPYFKDDNPPHRVHVHIELMRVPCQKKGCEFWLSECHWFDPKEPQKCDPSDCDEEGRDYLECKGGCRLI